MESFRKNWKLVVLGADLRDTKLFFYLLAVEHVIYTEWYDPIIWSHVVNDAVVRPLNIERVRVHECHTPN